jgi:hypothetical protein
VARDPTLQPGEESFSAVDVVHARCHAIAQISKAAGRGGWPLSVVAGASRDGQRGNYVLAGRGPPYFRPGPRRPASEAAPESEEEARKGCRFRGNLEAGCVGPAGW